MQPNEQILIGKIVGAHGLRGEVRIQTYTAKPLDLRDMDVHGAKIISVKMSAPNSTVVIAKVDGVNDRNSAEALRNTDLFVYRSSLPAPGDNEYYIADLIGMEVSVASGKKLGKVSDVHNFGAGDVLELESGEMISFHTAKVDLEKRVIGVMVELVDTLP